MLSRKLWAFGCSHVEGYELGTKYKDTYKHWLYDNFKITSRNEGEKKFGWEKYVKVVEKPWFKLIGNISNPSLSFTGLIAKTLNCDLINLGKNGTGIDRSFYNIIVNEKNIDWNNDIVILGANSWPRWMIDVNNSSLDVIARNMSDKKIINYFPCIESHIITYFSILAAIKKFFPKVIIVGIHININIESLEKFIKFDVQKLMYDFVIGEDDRYPGGHFTESVHNRFANYIIEEMELS